MADGEQSQGGMTRVVVDPGQDKGAKFENMDFSKMSPELFSSAVNAAKDLMASKDGQHLEKTEIGQIAASIDKTGKPTVDSVAATLLAENMDVENKSKLRPGGAGTEVTSTVGGGRMVLDLSEKPVDLKLQDKLYNSADAQIVALEAAQILKGQKPEEVATGANVAPASAAKDVAQHTANSSRSF